MKINFKKNQVINNLKIIKQVENDKHGRKQYLCTCLLCGKQTTEKGTNINTGKKTSCGCDKLLKIKKTKIKHNGHKLHPKEYRAWKGMKGRCYNPNYEHFHRYGGRGIVVCERWKNSFPNFYNDMGDAPTPKHQLDRIDNNGIYEPSNCRWVTPKENCNNRSKYKSKSGYTGVFYRENKNRYEVNVCVNRKSLHVGVFYDLEEAVNARKEFIIKYNNEHGTKLKYEEFVK